MIIVVPLWDSPILSRRPLRKGFSPVDEGISDLKADQEVLQQQITVYEDAQRRVQELSFVNQIAQEVLPSDKSQARAVAEIKSFASDAGIGIQSIDFTGPGTVKDPKNSQTQVVKGLKGVRVLPVNVVFQQGVSYSQLLDFLDNLETNRRKMQVTNVSLTPNANDRNEFNAASLSIDVYLKAQQ